MQREADRLDLQHHVLCLTFASKLYFAPIENPRHALDVGTGTGIWAIDMGRSQSRVGRVKCCTDKSASRPTSRVSGHRHRPQSRPADTVSNIAPTHLPSLADQCSVPPNLKFIVDDAEDTWLYQNKFDLIHARLMSGSFADWPNFFRQSYE
jgi:hypothetical protein